MALLGSFCQKPHAREESGSRDMNRKVPKRPKNRICLKAYISGTKRAIENLIRFSESSVLSLQKMAQNPIFMPPSIHPSIDG